MPRNLGRAEFGEHRHRRRDFAADAEADDRAGKTKHGEVRRHRAGRRADGEQQEIDRQHDPPAVAVAENARQQSPDGGAAEGDRVEKSDIRAGETPVLLENGAGDADRVLFEAVEQATDQDKGEDLLVRAGNADFGESRFQLSNDRRTPAGRHHIFRCHCCSPCG
ncbi:hypothetical protein ACVMB3_000470 [Sinorhizobium meliloti]